MSIFKCKMCGGELEILENSSVAKCLYCRTKQTVPKSMDENMQNIFNRANALRLKSEFDKAEALYERIIQADDTQAEAYWGLILCKYGIEYVDDPATARKIPTCHRASYDSIIADEDYKSALAHADFEQRALYEEQATEIDRIQKEILALAQREEKYDVFICYKETDANGQRTQDSVIANDIYYQLTNEGFKVFYAAITLEGKLGSAYEPIIFAALNSAKVMLTIGTKPEYFNAVWVRNEWSRFLKIIKKDRSKLLIPCYRDMDAYELPDEFAHLQAQDMSKIGFINDIVRGIQKVVAKDEPKTTIVKETIVSNSSINVAPLLKRAFMFLEDGDWASADEYCEKVLDQDPECAQAYLGKLMAELKIRKPEGLKSCSEPFDNRPSYQKVMRFADDELKAKVNGYIEFINNRRLDAIYMNAVSMMKTASTISHYEKAISAFEGIRGWKDADKLIAECENAIEELKIKAESNRKDKILNEAKAKIDGAPGIITLGEIIENLQTISGWKNADELIVNCENTIEALKVEAENNRKDKILTDTKAKMSTTHISDYQKLIANFKSISGWKDADEQVVICEEKIATYEREKAEKERILELKRKRRIRIGIISAVVLAVVVTLSIIFVPKIMVKSYISQGRYAEAIELGNLTEFTIPDGVTSIDDKAFKDCATLTSVTIPSSVTKIGVSAFEGCSNLTAVIIPDSVTSIGVSVFEGCSSLTSVKIPDSVTSIGDNAFYGCSSLTSVKIPDSVTSIGDNAFRSCSKLTSITMPDSLTSIGDYAFHSCFSLTNVTIPNSVTSMGKYAFYDCSNLREITIPNGIVKIENGLFSNCSKLAKIIIPDSVESIAANAFDSCSILTEIIIPDSVKSIGDNSFYNCPIQKATVPASAISAIKSKHLKEVVITSGEIPDKAFLGCSALTSVEMLDGVTSIGNSAFRECSGLAKVIIPNSVTSIGSGAFTSCSNLTNIVIPNSVRSMGAATFSFCGNLTDIVIPSSVTKLGTDLFYYCWKLSNINYSGTEEQWSAISKEDDWCASTSKELNVVYNYTDK